VGFRYSKSMQEKNRDTIHDFFYSFSRIVIIIPIIVVIFSVLLKISKSETTVTENITMPAPTQTTVLSTSQNNKVIDLQGPSICVFQTKEASWSALIQNRNISAVSNSKTKVIHYLIKDDCFYTWEKNKYTGEKMCGIGQLLSIGESVINSGFMNKNMFDMLLNQSKINLPVSIKYEDFQKMKTSCKPVDSIPISQFELPKRVLFKSK